MKRTRTRQFTTQPSSHTVENALAAPRETPAKTDPALVMLSRTVGNRRLQHMLRPNAIQRGFFDDIGSMISDATDTVGDLVSEGVKAVKKATKAAIKAVSPGETMTVTSSKAYLSFEDPPNFKKGPKLPEGVHVTVQETMTHKKKEYAKVEQVGSAELGVALGGWTLMSNLGHASMIHYYDDPSLLDSADAPTMPNVDHPMVQQIVEEIAKLEAESLSTPRMSEEEGEERADRLEQIELLRARVGQLSASALGVSEATLYQLQASLYRRINPLAPYFTQFGNANVLASSKKGAWERTCNVTVPAMVIEGLGKSKGDYEGSENLLERIFAALEGKYLATYNSKTKLSDFDSLRLPDYMQLVGISFKLSDSAAAKEGKAFEDAVEKARQKAAAATTGHATMLKLMESFGARAERGWINTGTLDKIGGARRAHVWNELQKGITGSSGKTKEEQDAAKTSYDSVDADALLSVSTYKKNVISKIKPALDSGAQVLVGMENHFIRLQSMDDSHLVVDDPGRKAFKNLRVTWEQARDLGYFKGYWVVR